MEYLVVNTGINHHNGCVHEFSCQSDAVNYADLSFNSVKDNYYDVNSTEFLAVIKSCNPDENSEEHFDGDPVKTYIVDGSINPELLPFETLDWNDIKMFLDGNSMFDAHSHDLCELADLDIVHIVEEMPNWSWLENYPIEEELERRSGLCRSDYIDTIEFDDGSIDKRYDFEKFIMDACDKLK